MTNFKLVSLKVFQEITGIHVTINHTGKMEGMQSLSTTCKCNPICISRICTAKKNKALFDDLKKKIKKRREPH